MPRVVTEKVKKSCSAHIGRELRKTREGKEETEAGSLWAAAAGRRSGVRLARLATRHEVGGCVCSAQKRTAGHAQAGEVVLILNLETEERPCAISLPSPVSLRRHVLASLSATRSWASSTGALVTNVGRDEGCGLAAGGSFLSQSWSSPPRLFPSSASRSRYLTTSPALSPPAYSPDFSNLHLRQCSALRPVWISPAS